MSMTLSLRGFLAWLIFRPKSPTNTSLVREKDANLANLKRPNNIDKRWVISSDPSTPSKDTLPTDLVNPEEKTFHSVSQSDQLNE